MRGYSRGVHGVVAPARLCMLGALAWGCATDTRQLADTAPATECATANCAGVMPEAADTNPGMPEAVATSPGMPEAVATHSLEPARGVSGLAGGEACLSASRSMEQAPLALYVMLDSSGSMLEPAGQSGKGDSKWSAVQAALRAFLTEAQATDLSLGLQFFPLLKAGSSFVCTSHADCGPDGGPCFLSTCLQGEDITLCETDADCGPDPMLNPCVPFGLCANSDPAAPTACVLPSTCGDGLGVCEDFERTCTNATTCDPAVYAAPTVEIQPVSSGFQAIDQALLGKQPEGLTPTVPALQGALDQARVWAQAHPEQTVAILLATDGLPTDCDPAPPAGAPSALDQVLGIAASGIASSTPIRTYVVGAFPPGDSASATNVDAIAAAGGTEQAALIDTSGEVEEQFLEALRNVQGAAAPCTFEVSDASGLDFRRADVVFDAGDGTSSALPYVEGLLGCATNPQGWYYDTPPASGTPRQVSLCPNVCDIVRATPSVGLSLEIGCTGP